MRFIFNDDRTTNSYGFSILSAGGKFERFRNNPVMLDNHNHCTDDVIGRWDDLVVENGQISAVAVFDIEDEDAAKVAGKVERGFIRACSMGISFDRDKLKLINGQWVLMEWELMECSICSIPSAATALKLYAKTETGEYKLMDTAEINLSLDELKTAIKQTTTMEKVTLSVTSLLALGFKKQPDTMEQVDAAIEKLAADLLAEKDAHGHTKAALQTEAKLRAKRLVDEAKLAGKITELEATEIEASAISNYELTAKMLDKIPAKTNLSATNTGAGTVGLPKNIDEFEALEDSAKLSFKKDYPAQYKALFK